MLPREHKFTPSEELQSDFETSHYNGARGAFMVLEKEKLINDKVEEVVRNYPKIKKFLKKLVDLAPEEFKEKVTKDAKAFSEKRFQAVINLALKDHKNKHGISKRRTSWR